MILAHSKVDEVANQLTREILSRQRTNRRFLDPEWILAQRFGCSRVSLREACERLVGAGLLRKAPGEPMFIAGPAHWPLELLADELLVTRGEPSATMLLDDVLEFQRRNLVAIAEFSAERRTENDLFAMDQACFELDRAAGWMDDPLIDRIESELLGAFIESAGSRTLSLTGRTAFRVLNRLQIQRPLGRPWVDVATWKQLVEALRARESAAAQTLAKTMFAPMFRALRLAYAGEPELEAPSQSPASAEEESAAPTDP